jgi:hypothetical protein
MKPIPTPECKRTAVYPGADLPIESNLYIIRKIDEKDISPSAVVVSSVCLGWLLILSFAGIATCFS